MRHHSSRKRACRRRTKSSGRQLVCPRLGSCVKASWLVDIDDAAQLAPSTSGLFLHKVVLPPHHSIELLAKLQLHSAGAVPIISIPYLWSVGFYTARDPLVAPAPPGLVGSAGFYSADLILTGFKRRQRKLHGLSRERDAVLRRGGGLCWTRSLQGERSYSLDLQLYGSSCTVVPACSTSASLRYTSSSSLLGFCQRPLKTSFLAREWPSARFH